MKKHTLAIIIGYTLTHSTITAAQGLVMPDYVLRDNIQALINHGVINLNISTWPLSSEAIESALEKAAPQTENDKELIANVHAYLTQEAQNKIEIGLGINTDNYNTPASFDPNKAHLSKSQASISAKLGNEVWDGKIQINGINHKLDNNQNSVNFNGSYIARKIYNQWVSIGKIPAWWGPGQDASLIRSDNGNPITGLSMQRARQEPFKNKWLSNLGPWQYQLLAGQLDDYTAVPKAKIIGARVTLSPKPFLDLGAFRMIQWGGNGRQQTAKSFWNALIGKDNADGSIGYNDASNQIAGFDAEIKLQSLLKLPVSIYGQMIGEDEAGLMPYKKSWLFGLKGSKEIFTKNLNWYVEWANTQQDFKTNGVIYNHSTYLDGYYQNGYSIGHPMGGDGQILSTGGSVQLNSKNNIRTRLLYATVNPINQTINTVFPTTDTIKSAEVYWIHQPNKRIKINSGAWVVDSKTHKNDIGVGIQLQISTNIN